MANNTDQGTREQFFEIDLGSNGGLRRFNSIEEVQHWTDSEYSAWPLFQSSEGYRTSGLMNLFDARMQPVRQAVTQLMATGVHGYSNRRVQYINDLKTALQSCFNPSTGLIVSDSLRAEFLRDIAKHDPETACYAYLHFLKVDPPRVNFHSKSGATLATIFDAGGLSRPEYEENAYEQLRRRWEAELTQFREKYESLRTDSTSLKQYTQTLGDEFERSSSEKLKAAEAKLTEKLTECNSRMILLEEQFKQHMRLKAPVEYWSGKKRHHSITRWWLVGVTLFVAISGFLGMYFYVSKTFIDTVNLPAGSGVTTTGGGAISAQPIPWRELIVFALLSSAVFWAVRICVRLLLSSIHLYADAHEREVMATTYLALIKGDEGKPFVRDKDIKILLAALFRPTSSGIVNEDAAPATAFEMVQSILSKK